MKSSHALDPHIMSSDGRFLLGSPETVKRKVQAFIDETGADELILASHLFDEDKRMRSYEIAAEVRESLTPAKAASITS